MTTFLVEGGQSLKGKIDISGSKNAALPILAACLLTDEPCTLDNVPNIKDIDSFLEILHSLNVDVSKESQKITINAKNIKNQAIPSALINQMRASILLLGPLVSRFEQIELAYPGGCVLGKRSVHSHIYVLNKLGATVLAEDKSLSVTAKNRRGANLRLPEMSVTATENALMVAVLAEGKTIIRLAASEPHVQDLCHFLNALGAKITGIGTSTLQIEGVKKLHGASYRITSDYLETATLALAGILTNGQITLENVIPDHLDSFWQKLEEVGVNFDLEKNSLRINPSDQLKKAINLKTSVFPGFATDLQAPFAVLLSQCHGESYIFETLFEGRLNYLVELEKMGARVKIISPHEGLIYGPRRLKGTVVASCDIRAGAAMVLASLIAEGTTEITNVSYIDRGYENLEKKLCQLGAKISRRTD